MKCVFFSRAIALVALVGSSAFGQVEYDQPVHPDFFLGSGNANEDFTVARSGDVELGLHAKLRFNEDDGNRPANIFNSNGDGTYSFQARNVAGEDGLPGWWTFPESPEWSFEFSINSDTTDTDARPIGALTYELGLDFDPSAATNFFAFDPINVNYADHFFGTSETVVIDGSPGRAVAGDAADYATLKSTKTVAQQAWNYAFFLDFLPDFQADQIGVYDIYLKAFDNGTEIASVTIRVLVGAEQFPGDTPQEQVENATIVLTDYTASENIKAGIANSLDEKLENAIDAYIGSAIGSRETVVNRLQAYINAVEAQRGKKLKDSQADFLRSGAEDVMVLLYIAR